MSDTAIYYQSTSFQTCTQNMPVNDTISLKLCRHPNTTIQYVCWAFPNHLLFYFLLFTESFYYMLECGCTYLVQFKHKSITDAGRKGLVQWDSGLSFVAGQSSSSTPDSINLFIFLTCFVHRGIVTMEQKRTLAKLLPQSWMHTIL